MIDTEIDTEIWHNCLATPAWIGTPVWVHGELMPMNLIVIKGRLNAVIDFESMGVGDPSCDLIPAWNLLPKDTRYSFKTALCVDTATWQRGKGRAFSMALIQLPYYKDTNPMMAENAHYVIEEVLTSAS